MGPLVQPEMTVYWKRFSEGRDPVESESSPAECPCGALYPSTCCLGCAKPLWRVRVYPSVAQTRCHRGGFHFLKTLDFCHYRGQDGHREAHVLSCWPETSNPTSPGWPRTRLWERLLPRPARLARLSRADLNKTPQIETEAAADDGILWMRSRVLRPYLS